MDWKKIKTILIIAFLLLNIMIFGHIYSSNTGNPSKNTQLFYEKVERILMEKNILINCDIPSTTQLIPSLEITFKILTPNESTINKYIGTYSKPINNEVTFYKNESKHISFIGNKKLEYIDNSNYTPSDEQKSQTNESIILNFCKEKNISINEYYLNHSNITKDLTVINYVKKYNNYNIDNAYLKFYIKNSKIVKFQYQDIDYISEKGQIKTVSAYEALLRLLTLSNIKNKNITNMELCYSIPDDEIKNVTTTNIKYAWKVYFDDDTYEYLYSVD